MQLPVASALVFYFCSIWVLLKADPLPSSVASTLSEEPATTNLPLTNTTKEPLEESTTKQKQAHSQVMGAYRHRPPHHHEHHWGPFFEEPLNASSGQALNVSVHQDSRALLNCRVGMLHDKMVMWLRKTTEKVSLLTVGLNTYSGNSRLSINFQYPNNWRLQIYPVQREDAGIYMCQVSTYPPRVFTTNVTVMPPAIRIVDELGHEVYDRYYKMGSAIELTCQVALTFLSSLPVAPTTLPVTTPTDKTTTPVTTSTTITSTATKSSTIYQQGDYNATDKPTTVVYETTTRFVKKKPPQPVEIKTTNRLTWSRNGEKLPHNMSVENENTQMKWRSSRLSITHAAANDTGIYSCSVSNISSVIVQVNVLNGERQAAVHHDTFNKGNVKNIAVIYLYIILYFINVIYKNIL